MAKHREPWNGDLSLLKDEDVAVLIVDFRKRTVEVYVDKQHGYPTGGEYELVDNTTRNFTNVSPFGLIARGLRRMCSNEINREHW